MSVEHLRDRILHGVADLSSRHPRLSVLLSLLIAAAAIVTAVHGLEFWTGRNDLVSQEAEYNKLFLALNDEFGKQEDIVIVFTGGDPESMRRFADALGARLEQERDFVEHVFYKTDIESLTAKGLYYVPDTDLDLIRRDLSAMTPYVRRFAAAPGFTTAVQLALDEIDRSFFEIPQAEDAPRLKGDFLIDLYNQIAGEIRGEAAGPFDLESWFAGEREKPAPIYNFSGDQRFLFMTVLPREIPDSFHPVLPALNRIRTHLAAIGADYPQIETGVTGSPVLAADEMVTSSLDSARASVLSLVGVTLLFAVFFGRFTEPFIAVFTLLIGICWSVGFTTLTIGHLNLLSVVFSIILIGLGIDYGVHMIFRMQEESIEGRDPDRVISAAILGAGPGLITGGLTTAIAFATAWFTKFQGIAELGFIAGSGVLLCLIAALILLPALLKIRRHVIIRPRGMARIRKVQPVVDQPAFHPIVVLLAACALAGVGIYGFRYIRYDDNLLRLQAKGLPAVEWEHRIIRGAGQSTWYGALMIEDLDSLRRKRPVLESRPVVNRVEDVTDLLPKEQDTRRQQLAPVRAVVDEWPRRAGEPEPVRLADLVTRSRLLNFKLGVVDAWLTELDPRDRRLDDVRSLHRAIDRFLAAVENAETEPTEAQLTASQTRFVGDFERVLHRLLEMAYAPPVTPDDIPEPLRSRFVGRSGKFMMRIYPSEDIWESAERARFVSQLRAIEPNVTGSPFQVHESSLLMRDGYMEAGLYALIAIVVLVFLDFRTVFALILVLTPLFFGAAWTVGVMAWRGIPFNLANLLALPLILGIGVDNGVHMVHRFRQEGESASLVSGSTGRAVILCSLTSMIGFGALAFATHQGIASLGFVLFVGIGNCLLASITVLPALLHLCAVRKWRV